ncbi:MAG: hypothetical protein KKF12_21965 [Proteobacteria bacterium]|nr:hypothetical protein [Pseudomonadota bacterium]
MAPNYPLSGSALPNAPGLAYVMAQPISRGSQGRDSRVTLISVYTKIK